MSPNPRKNKRPTSASKGGDSKKEEPNSKQPTAAKPAVGAPASLDEQKRAVDNQIRQALLELEKARHTKVFPLCMGDARLTNNTVDDIYDKLTERFPAGNERLEVITDSPGGSIHAAYHLALLIRRFATKELVFVVPRWAKSAATLLVCAGNKICMGPVSELGPVDPQITHLNPLDKRLEEFSPLHIQATLQLIRDEFEKGNRDLAKGLLERLQFPLTLGGFTKSLEIGKHYLERLLGTRMITGQGSADKATAIAKRLVEGYVDHGFCIDIDEARSIGLAVEQMPTGHWDAVWKLHRLERNRQDLERKLRKQQMSELLKQLPPELLRSLASPIELEEVEGSQRHMGITSRVQSPQTEQDVESERNTTLLAVRVALALLRLRGELGMQEIEAIPFVGGGEEAEAVIDYLARHYNTEVYQKKIESDPILRWETFIRLR